MINEYNAHRFCRDDISKIENYDKAINDTTQTWEIHHRLELTLEGEFALSSEQLKMHDMYYNRPYYELIFLTPAEHRSIHHKGKTISGEHRSRISKSNKGRIFSEEHCKKISESKKGEKNPNYGKHFSEEHRRKMSEARKRRVTSEDTKRKMSEAHKRRLDICETSFKNN